VRTLVSLGIAVVLLISGTAGAVLAQTSGSTSAADKKAETKKVASRNVSGTVKSSSADALVVTGRDKGKDAEWTFAVDVTTNIRKGSKSITAGDLKAGDAVQVRYVEQNGKATAQSVLVKAAKKDPKR
jgi:hypothetical protein